MHGAGNDYIYINGFESGPEDWGRLSISMSDRHKGVGSDGLIAILPSEVADFKMRMFNADGSEGEMCGNASRCIAKFVYEKGLTQKHIVTLETMAGIKTLVLNIEDDEIKDITVDMGEPIFEPEKIPVSISEDIINYPLNTSFGEVQISAVSLGNPHGVVIVKDLSAINIPVLGKELECHPLFPKKANIEFAQILSPSEIRMRVWERGSGETLACGTGACATLAICVMQGKSNREAVLHLLGGDLKIKWDSSNNHIYMTGEAETVFEGIYNYKN